MRAFHGNAQTKLMFQTRAKQLRCGKRVAVGSNRNILACLDRQDDRGCRSELGIPAELVTLANTIGQGLPPGPANNWVLAFFSAITSGADLTDITARFAIAILSDPEYGVARLVKGDHHQRPILEVARLLDLKVSHGDRITAIQWFDAATAALKPVTVSGDALTVCQERGSLRQFLLEVAAAQSAFSAAMSEFVRDLPEWQRDQTNGSSKLTIEGAASFAAEANAFACLNEASQDTEYCISCAWQADTLIRLLKEAPVAALS